MLKPFALNHIHLPAVDSTNAEAFARAEAGEVAPFWVTAGEQLAGRGRRGRTWSSPPGNLYASLCLTDPAPVPAAAGLCFVAALALIDALDTLAPTLASRLTLKWPNDVLLDGAKIAGILIEGQGVDPLRVVVGLGVNLAHHPDGTPYPATHLAQAGVILAPLVLHDTLDRTFGRRLVQWNRGQGMAATLADWRRRASGLEGDMRIQLPNRIFVARFADLDIDGRLIVAHADGSRETVTAADVFPLPPAVGA